MKGEDKMLQKAKKKRSNVNHWRRCDFPGSDRRSERRHQLGRISLAQRPSTCGETSPYPHRLDQAAFPERPVCACVGRPAGVIDFALEGAPPNAPGCGVVIGRTFGELHFGKLGESVEYFTIRMICTTVDMGPGQLVSF